MSVRVLVLLSLTLCLHSIAQECTDAPTFTSQELEQRDAGECHVAEAPACQRIRPASTDVIFIGTVLGIKESDGHMILNGECVKTLLQTVTLRVDESLVGKETGTTTVKAGDINGFYFQSRKRFLVFAQRDRDGTLSVTGCGGTKRLADAKADIDYLRAWNNLPSGATIYGNAFIRTNRDDPQRMVIFKAKALSQASVTIAGLKTFTVSTNSKGQFEVDGLPPGTYQVTIVVPYVTWPAKSTRVEVVDRGCADVKFYVDPFASKLDNSTNTR
jgi:Prealbumin-like fold domain